jgi:hypothetical protein
MTSKFDIDLLKHNAELWDQFARNPIRINLPLPNHVFPPPTASPGTELRFEISSPDIRGGSCEFITATAADLPSAAWAWYVSNRGPINLAQKPRIHVRHILDNGEYSAFGHVVCVNGGAPFVVNGVAR